MRPIPYLRDDEHKPCIHMFCDHCKKILPFKIIPCTKFSWRVVCPKCGDVNLMTKKEDPYGNQG